MNFRQRRNRSRVATVDYLCKYNANLNPYGFHVDPTCEIPNPSTAAAMHNKRVPYNCNWWDPVSAPNCVSALHQCWATCLGTAAFGGHCRRAVSSGAPSKTASEAHCRRSIITRRRDSPAENPPGRRKRLADLSPSVGTAAISH